MTQSMQSFGDAFRGIDLSRPWLEPFVGINQAFGTHGQLPLSVWLNSYFAQENLSAVSHAGQALGFTNQSDLPHGVAYEQFIAKTGKIPTRDNLHDWFGACIWATFPKSKAVLNHHHRHNFADNHYGNGRNRVRDAITVFDENGIILAVSDDTTGRQIAECLCQFDWTGSLIVPRQSWYRPSADVRTDIHAQAFVFGHALLEQLIHPRKNLCGHTLIVEVDAVFFQASLSDKLAILDRCTARHLDEWLSKPMTTPRDLQPLPVLGIPYFWDGQDDGFYQDESVFRRGRRR